MKAKTFENLIRKIVREEIDYSLRREIKSLKEDLRDELKPVIKETTKVSNEPMPENAKNSLREKIMGKQPIKKQKFVSDNTLNDLLNETAAGNTNTESAMAPIAPVSDPFSTSGVIPTETMPEPLQGVVNRDYRALMQAIDKKKGK